MKNERRNKKTKKTKRKLVLKKDSKKTQKSFSKRGDIKPLHEESKKDEDIKPLQEESKKDEDIKPLQEESKKDEDIKPLQEAFRKRGDIPECNEEDKIKDLIKENQSERKEKKKECDKKLYSFIVKYFDPNTNKKTIKDLLCALYNLYTNQKKEDINYKLSLEQFILMFPRDTSTDKYNFRRQHVFEAICLFMLLYNYDNNYWGKNKVFYKSLEGYIKGTREEETNNHIMNKNINDGSSAQSVDIFFKIPKEAKDGEGKEAKDDEDNEPSCISFKRGKVKDTGDKDLFILIQNKFYDQEKSSADKYDVQKISERSRGLTNKLLESVDKKIILMVNSKESLDKKITACRNNDFNLVDEIFGLAQLDVWFQEMLYDIYKSKSFEEFIKIEGTNNKKSLQLRFHQDIFCDTTEKYIQDSHKKFIWGAVPRSGKSYMISGMIDKRNKLGSNNDILIILGAKSETESQFISMFKEFENFDDYGIIKVSDDIRKASKEIKKKNIFITSQEKLKINKKDETIRKHFEGLFKKKQIDIYFDEIHKGGSSLKAQEIIDFFVKEEFKIDLFVMVTATYAKPVVAYQNIVDNKPPIILNWSYEDQQLMKQISNDVKLYEFKSTRNNDFEREIIDNLLLDYNAKYGKDYLKILEDEYKKHPELVIIQPFIDIQDKKEFTISDEEKFSIHGNVFKLSCDGISDNIKSLRDPTKIFHDNNSVKKLINFIGEETSAKTLDANCVYGKMVHKYGYNIIDTLHSELWFLPDKSLYDKHEQDKCREELIDKGFKFSKNDDQEGDAALYDEQDDSKKSKKSNSLPNIEPLTRGLVLNLLKNKFFKEHYCFLIVHNQKITYYDGKKDQTEDVFLKEECVKIHSENPKDDIKNKITEFERITFHKNKSLIILTGSMLRLGISLPCVDIAFNFDGVTSVDINYQTMFRVLTERKGKKYGYYIDFNPKRAISFLYDYNDHYSPANNEKDMITIKDIQSTLYLFNYNGLSITNINTIDTLKLYNKLISELKINEKELVSRYISNIKNRFVKLLRSLGDIPILKDLAHFQQESDDLKKKIAIKLKEGKKKETEVIHLDDKEGEMKEGEKEEEMKEDDESEEIEPDIQNIAVFLAIYVPMISLFSLEICESHGNTFVDCLNNLLKYVEKNVPDEKPLLNYCKENCNSLSEPLLCYMNLISGYDKKKFIRSLKSLRSLYDKNKELKNEKISKLTRTINNIYISIKENMGNKENLICNMTTNEIRKKIEDYLPVRDKEKNEFGEVFTPETLINEMLDKLPSKVWKEPEYKWLDPANGIGNFPMKVFERLDQGLKDVNGFKDEKTRKKHIIENMLYMVELNPKNVAVSKKIFGKDANIYCGSFLENGWQGKFGIDKFDVIIGNPPYNEGATGRSGLKNLDEIFTIESLKHLKDNKYLLFIIKTTIRGITSKGYDSIIDKQILYSKVFDFKNNPFSENVLTNYLLIQNCNKKIQTTFEYGNKIEKGHIYKGLNIYFLPIKFSNVLIEDITRYGSLEKITRGLKGTAKNYLLVRHSTSEVKISKKKPEGDKYYIIPNPSKKMINFFKEKYPILRQYGLFNGFSTSKSLFLNIPNYNLTKSISKTDKLTRKVKSLPKPKKTRSNKRTSNKSTRKVKSLPKPKKTRSNKK